MAQMCQYDHPLLWCESKRRAEEKRIAEESWTIAQQRKEQIEAQKHRDSNEVSERAPLPMHANFWVTQISS